MGAITLIAAVISWATGGQSDDTNLHLSMADIRSIETEETVPAAALLNFTSAAYICSIGPYFEADFATTELGQELLKRLDVFPIPEADGLFIYLTKAEATPAIDRLHLNSGRLRWRADENNTRCVEVGRAAFKVKKQKDHWEISLFELK